MRPRAVVLMLVIAFLAAPRAQQPPAPAPAPAPPVPKALVPVAASTLAAKPDAYVGEFVSLTGVVEQSLAPLAFSVDQDKTKATGKEVLVLSRRMNSPLEPNTYVTVIGEVVRFDPAEIAGKTKEYPINLSPDAVAKYRGRPAILATSVINAAGVDVAMRLPPPLTAEDEAYMKIMKQVASANAALRKAMEGSDVKLARDNTAALKQAFTQTEVFWRSKRKADAMGFAQDARKVTETIDAAAAAGKWDEVKTSAGTLGKTCQTCHTAYRERFDDGSFRIKRPAGVE